MLDTAPKARLVVHNPMGYPPKVSRKTPAGRLDRLDGRTIYLVDVRFDDSIELPSYQGQSANLLGRASA